MYRRGEDSSTLQYAPIFLLGCETSVASLDLSPRWVSSSPPAAYSSEGDETIAVVRAVCNSSVPRPAPTLGWEHRRLLLDRAGDEVVTEPICISAHQVVTPAPDDSIALNDLPATGVAGDDYVFQVGKHAAGAKLREEGVDHIE